MTSGLLRPSLTAEIPNLSRQFQEAVPFRHVVIEDFLSAEFCADLRREFPAFEDRYATNELGAVGLKAVVENLPQISPAYSRFDGLIQSAEFLRLIGDLTGISGLLYDPDYFGGGTHENRSGQDLLIHVDFNYHPKTQTHRRLNLIVFLNPEWDESWGGCLELHRNPWGDPSSDEVVSILPLCNRCVIFETTESSWHGFSRIQIPPEREPLSRRSVAVYFYSQERPAAETAPAHSTVYVPAPLPGHLTPGHTLTEDDLYLLELLLRRRDQQIHFLYEREKEFSSVLEENRAVLRSTQFRLARALANPRRLLRRLRG